MITQENTDASVFEIHNLIREVERRALESGLTLEFDPKAPSAHTNGKHLVFPLMRAPLSVDDLAILKHMSIHEPLHIKRNDIYKIAEREKLSFNSPLGTLFNAIEDEVMEHEHSLNYEGDRRDLDRGHVLCYNKMVGMIEKADPSTMTEDQINVNALFLMIAGARARWNEDVAHVFNQVIKASHPKALEKFVELDKAGVVNAVAQVGDVEHSYQTARETYKILFKGDPDTTEAKGEPPPCEGKKPGEAEGEGEGKGTPNGADGDDEGEGGEKGKHRGIIKISDILKSTHTEEQLKDACFNLGVDYSEKGKMGGWMPSPKEFIRVHDLKLEGELPPGWVKLTGIDTNTAQLANNLRRLMLVETRSEYKSELLAGRLSKKNLYRAAMPLIGDGTWNAKVFRKRVDHQNMDTCISVLVDWSGSMQGEKMNIAAHSAFRLYDVFAKSLRIPVEVLSFASRASYIEHGIVKPYSEKIIHKNAFIGRFNRMSNYTGGNADADALLWATERILKRPEARKIVFVLSDGSPTDTWDNTKFDADYGLQKVIADIKRQRKVEVYGIGIQMHNITRYYGPNCKNIDDINKLDQALLNTMHDVVIKQHI